MSDKKSRDINKLGKFYNFEVTDQKFFTAQNKAKSLYFRHFRNAFIFGFFIEAMIINTRIYENIIKSSTTKRLESKRKEDENLREKRILIEKKGLKNQ